MNDLLNLFDSLHVDDVKNLHDKSTPSEESNQPTLPRTSAIGELLTIWHQDPQYLNQKGEPIPLRIRSSRRSFYKLANKTVPKLAPWEVLSELQRIGAVSTDNRGFVHARTRSLSVYEDRQLAVQHTLYTLSSVIKTLRHNIDSAVSNSEQLFHRVAWNGKIELQEIPKLKIWLKKRGQLFLESADSWMMRRSQLPHSGQLRHAKYRQVSIGVYLSIDHA